MLLTNDDGITSEGLHILARAMEPIGDVVVVAPDGEYSGAGASIGSATGESREIRRHQIDGIGEAWSVNGPPALCVLYARLGLFGEPFDLVVSGINPGANVGRAVYHSGTVGACLSGRNGGISGVAVSQSVTAGADGQAWGTDFGDQRWETAAAVAQAFVGALVAAPPADPVVANLNVPNLPLDEVRGWRLAHLGEAPPRTMTAASLTPTPDPDTFGVAIEWGQVGAIDETVDGGAVEAGWVAVSYISRLVHEERNDLHAAEAALTDVAGPAAPR